MAEVGANVSVAVATLDRPASLARCLDALEAGTVRPAEIVVVDQSAQDETEQMLTWRRSVAPLRYIRQPRRGLSASRNAALRAAAHPLVAMTDDDCVPGAEWVAAIGRRFRDPTVSAVSGRLLPLGPERPGMYAVSSRLSDERALFDRKGPPWLAGSGGNFAVRKRVSEQLGGFDERLGAGTRGQSGEDVDFIYRMLAARERIAYEPAAVVYHERQELARRMASRWGYGYGMGAACGKWLRGGDAYALRLFGGWLLWRGRGLVAAARAGRRQTVSEHSLMLRGTVAGFAYGLQLGDARR